MYTRAPQGRFPRDMRIPKNYAGNAFSPPLIAEENENISFNENEDITQKKNKSVISQNEISADFNNENEAAHQEATKQTGIFSFPKLDLGLGKIFSRGGLSLDGEELLILGLILLIASGGMGDDLLLLLILLLFIH